MIITEGKEGARFFDGEKEWLVPGISVPVVDTTGAGDTFNAAFAVQIAGENPFMKPLNSPTMPPHCL